MTVLIATNAVMQAAPGPDAKAAKQDASDAPSTAAADAVPSKVTATASSPQPASAQNGGAATCDADGVSTSDLGAAASPAAPVAADPSEAESTQLQWSLRGGGGRGRSGGNPRHKGLDPVVPLTDPGLLDPVVAFYGLEGCVLVGFYVLFRFSVLPLIPDLSQNEQKELVLVRC